MQKADILVIGATGTIGRYLLEKLRLRGATFKALVRNVDKALALQQSGVAVAMGDLSDPESLRRAMQGVRKLFLLSSPSDRQVELQHNAIEAARAAGVAHIVKVSALGSLPDSPIQLARMHAQTEDEIRQSGMAWTFLHPHTLMQNWFWHVQQVREQGILYSFTQQGRYSPIDARDIAEVAARILTEAGHEGQTYYLTGPEAVSMKDVANALELALDKDIKLIAVPAEMSYQPLLQAGLPDWLAKDLAELNKTYAQSLGDDTSPDFERITGRRATSVKQFAADHARVFR
ncbi:SDR family oxidoreductase [Cesiribacter andamanensis]|uniref:NAD(P)H azoreductase n=1 Tax=Cesiribacter andamanensis AMV16 TaxID=1279009 RepID=M7NB77_9BACT|nr:SDR family oxidoreductase [Cesiribacter andamanensis]EMR04456.1 NAD(P)H azoreductase [Cesiribacter andamanensis AMV16]